MSGVVSVDHLNVVVSVVSQCFGVYLLPVSLVIAEKRYCRDLLRLVKRPKHVPCTCPIALLRAEALDELVIIRRFV